VWCVSCLLYPGQAGCRRHLRWKDSQIEGTSRNVKGTLKEHQETTMIARTWHTWEYWQNNYWQTAEGSVRDAVQCQCHCVSAFMFQIVSYCFSMRKWIE
jgi:hypothetical protein